jgi:hypothetical protein
MTTTTRAHRTIGVQDRDRALPDGLKGAPDMKGLGLAADEHRYPLELVRSLLRRLGGRRSATAAARAGATASCFGCRSALAAAHWACNWAIRSRAFALASSACALVSSRRQLVPGMPVDSFIQTFRNPRSPCWCRVERDRATGSPTRECQESGKDRGLFRCLALRNGDARNNNSRGAQSP